MPTQRARNELEPGLYDLALLRLLCEQHAIPIDQLARFFGVYVSDMARYVAQLEQAGWVGVEKFIEGDFPWVWARDPGARQAGLGFRCRVPCSASLSHWRAINEARLLVGPGSPGLEWVCERRLRREMGRKLRGFVPDALVVANGRRYAIEVELSVKSPSELAEKLATHEGRYDGVVYFATPEVCRYFERLGLCRSHPKLVVHEIAAVERRLNRLAWRVPGDPAARGGGFKALSDLCLSESDLDVLDLFADQGAIPMDQLRRFLDVDAAAAEELVLRFVRDGLVQRARPLAKEPIWVWLRKKGMDASRRDLSFHAPRLGGLRMLRSVNAVRLLLAAPGSDVRWVSGRVLRRQHGARGSLPQAVVEVGGERHAIDVVLKAPEAYLLRRRLARRSTDYDAVVWFYSRQACAGVEKFAASKPSPKLLVRPICKAEMRGLRNPKYRRAAGLTQRSAANSRDLWVRLGSRPPVAVHPVFVESLPPQVAQALARASASLVSPRIDAAWQRLCGRGSQLYYVESAVGAYRVIHTGWGWRADAVRRPDLFVKQPGPPIDPRLPRPKRGGTYSTIEPKSLEFDDEVWAQVRPLIPAVEARPKAHAGRRPLADKVMLSGMVWLIRTETPLSGLSREQGYGTGAVRERLRYWEGLGVWDPVRELLARLLPDGDELNWNWLAPRGAPGAPRRRGG